MFKLGNRCNAVQTYNFSKRIEYPLLGYSSAYETHTDAPDMQSLQYPLAQAFGGNREMIASNRMVCWSPHKLHVDLELHVVPMWGQAQPLSPISGGASAACTHSAWSLRCCKLKGR